MKRERERVDQTPTAASTTSQGADLDTDPTLLGSLRSKPAHKAIRARQTLRAIQAATIGQRPTTAPADSANLHRAGSPCRSSDGAWTAAHRWPPESEHHRRGPASSAITANVGQPTDKESA